jgi:hypothetical protein
MHELKLTFDVDVSQFRRVGTALVDEDRLLSEVLRGSGAVRLSQNQIRHAVVSLDKGPISCRGHDVVMALGDVLHRDYNVTQAKCKALPELLRMAVDKGQLDDWSVVERLRAWEDAHRRVILNR